MNENENIEEDFPILKKFPYLKKNIKAGEILKIVREKSKTLIEEEKKLLEIAEFVERKILSLRGGIAFPLNISLNDQAAHYSPPFNDETTLKKGDYVKIDIGVHLEGFIADSAYTIKVGEEKDDLIKASEKALSEAISIIKAGVKTNEIGGVIQEAIEGYGLKPVENLSGHALKEYSFHAPPSIPNTDTGKGVPLKEGDVIALEPFATDGVGRVIDDDRTYIYSFLAFRPLRLAMAKRMMFHIKKNFPQLPFAERWVVKSKKDEFALRYLIRKSVVFPYYVLKEKTGGMISQAEHTVIVTQDGNEVIT